MAASSLDMSRLWREPIAQLTLIMSTKKAGLFLKPRIDKLTRVACFYFNFFRFSFFYFCFALFLRQTVENKNLTTVSKAIWWLSTYSTNLNIQPPLWTQWCAQLWTKDWNATVDNCFTPFVQLSNWKLDVSLGSPQFIGARHQKLNPPIQIRLNCSAGKYHKTCPTFKLIGLNSARRKRLQRWNSPVHFGDGIKSVSSGEGRCSSSS